MTISISTLSNGLRVISDRNDRVDSAAVGVWVNVGSRHESPEVNGIAHFLEHMAFKGTKTKSAKQIAESIENVGGYLNACTSRESTAYYARVLKEDVGMAIELLADIIQNSVFDPEEINREREVILQEISQCNDTPDDIIFDIFQETAYQNQAIGRSILGPQDIVRRVTREDLQAFIGQKYAASQMVLSATGNVDHDAVVKWAEAAFKGLQRDADIFFEPANYTGGSSIQERDLEQLHLLIGYKAMSMDDPDYYSLCVLTSLFGGGMSSVLFQEIREKRGLAYSIYAFKSCFSDSGMLAIYAGTAPEQAPELLTVIFEEIKNIANNLTEEAIQRSRAQLKAGLLMSLESVSSRCEQLAQHMMFFGRPISRAEIIDRVDSVTKESLLRVAEYIFAQQPTITVLGKTEFMPSLASLGLSCDNEARVANEK
ncbi:MAG: insulinase family protein [Alphaproteobacteria bacterium]|nr:insulinase family protein [Alphaproteobacteria bacterium]